ncbi:MAG: nucleotidyltransferase family protein [Armatimonadota bacterium]
MILAGGLGTRLRSAVPDLPKPMAEVAGRPFLDYLLMQVRRAGICDIVLCVGYKAEAIEAYYGDGIRLDLKFHYAYERELLGTAGALTQAAEYIRTDTFIVMNGDSYCEVDFNDLLATHAARRASVTITAMYQEDRLRFGSLEIDQQDAITAFIEKGEASGPGYINGGIYAMSREILNRIPAGVPSSLEKDIFPQLLGQGLYAFKTAGAFIDIGIPSEYARAARVLPATL